MNINRSHRFLYKIDVNLYVNISLSQKRMLTYTLTWVFLSRQTVRWGFCCSEHGQRVSSLSLDRLPSKSG